jgi:hypothetical protein
LTHYEHKQLLIDPQTRYSAAICFRINGIIFP